LQRSEAIIHREISRLWGCYDCIDDDNRFQVKRIMVKVGKKLSLQMYHRRAEHWQTIISNSAAIQSNNKEQQIHA
jgi:mannose-6-phosphate isomerase-like protein (cupin superfamily)